MPYAPIPVTMPNFVAVGQTVYQKSLTISLPPSLFEGLRGPSGPKFTSLGGDVQEGPFCQVPNFVSF